MSGMVIDFPTGRRVPQDKDEAERKATAQKAAAQGEEAKARRLASAPEIAGRLKAGKVPEADREQFARNLGRMWEKAERRGDRRSMAGLFQEAFKDRYGDLFKKRKRLLLRDGDTPERSSRDGDPVFQAAGRDYLRLAEAILVPAGNPQGDAGAEEGQRRAVLQLVAGSSFERQTAPAARLRIEATDRIAREAETIAERIAAKVDLDWMRQVLRAYDVAAVIDAEGEIEELLPGTVMLKATALAERAKRDIFRTHLPKHWSELTPEDRERLAPEEREDFEASEVVMAYDQGNKEPVHLWPSSMETGEDEIFATEHWAPFAPRAVLGHVFTPYAVESGRIDLPFDAAEVERHVEAQRAGFERAVARAGEAASGLVFDAAKARRERLKEGVARGLSRRLGLPEEVDLDDLDKAINEAGLEPWADAEELTIWIRRRLELRLAYDEVLDRWRLSLALVHGVGKEIFGREGSYGLRKRRDAFLSIEDYLSPYEFIPATNLGLCSLPLNHDVGGGLLVLPNGASTLSVFSLFEDGVCREKFLGMCSGSLVMTGAAAFDALLTEIEMVEIDGHVVSLDVGADGLFGPIPAPHDTLAGHILRNLAYAPDGERLDRRLLQDAQRKEKLLKELQAATLSAYDNAISRLRSS